jgi:hypothetical protein
MIATVSTGEPNQQLRALYEKAKEKMDRDEDPDDIIHALHDEAKAELRRRSNLN